MTTASQFLQYTISGLTAGSIYALTALGFTMIFNTTRIINFAQGEFLMLGGMLAVFGMRWLNLSVPLAVIVAVACTTIIGVLIDRLAIRPVRSKDVVTLIIITIGISILLRGGVMMIFGKDSFPMPPFSGSTPFSVGGAALLPQSLWVVGIAASTVVAMKLFFDCTIVGKAMLACSFDPQAASLMGINVSNMVTLSFAISAMIGALGGVIMAPITLTSYDVGALLGLKGFAACILGGLGNPFGVVVGGLILGVLEAWGAGLVSSGYKDAIAFVILVVLLFVRPSGLFGRPQVERV